MVDAGARNGKNPDMNSGWLTVVAAALQAGDDHWVMHRRPFEKHHGGLWEFPGGKVEDAEIPVNSLIRELHEELGIIVAAEDCEPIAFAEERDARGRTPIVILLYRIAVWEGEARALEGGEVGLFTRSGIAKLDKPPLDQELAKRLFAET